VPRPRGIKRSGGHVAEGVRPDADTARGHGLHTGGVLALAALVAVLHGAAVAFLVSGSLLALRWPRLLWLHVPIGLAILALYLTGSDCPLTTWELRLRAAAGEPGYSGGFIGHYLTEPLGFPIHATTTQIGIYVLAFLPNLVGYGLLAARWTRARRYDTPDRRPAVSPARPLG
jgi:hypothetical protein